MAILRATTVTVAMTSAILSGGGCSRQEEKPPPLPPSAPLAPLPPPLSKKVSSASIVAKSPGPSGTPIDAIHRNEEFAFESRLELRDANLADRLRATIEVAAVSRKGSLVVLQQQTAWFKRVAPGIYRIDGTISVPGPATDKARLQIKLDGDVIADQPLVIREPE